MPRKRPQYFFTGLEGVMGQVLSRRMLLRRLGTSVALVAGIAALRRGERKLSASAQAMNVCYWRKEASICSGGVLKEKWCHVCCFGLECEVEWCEWRYIGPC
jgi:hypothetical protein